MYSFRTKDSASPRRHLTADDETVDNSKSLDVGTMSQSSFVRRSSYRDVGSNLQDDDDSKSISSRSKEMEDIQEEGKSASEVQELFAHFQQQAQDSIRNPSPRRFEMASGGTKLAQEIQDEFLMCKICLEQYKNPKCLNCLHTFCENCIENHVASESTYKKYSDYREFTCPLCRKRTQLPIGGVKKLPDNFLVSSLGEVIGRQKPSKFPFCDICKLVSHKHREASSKCLDCAKLLCKQCVEMHKETKVTSSHNIFDVEIEKDIECKTHEDEVVRFYCEPCETCICVLCTFNEHKDHDISQFGDAVARYRDNIQDMLDSCKDKIDTFDTQIVSLNKVEEIIKEAEQKIHDTAIQFISDIRTREKQLVEELRNLYGTDLMNYVDNKKDMATTMESLRSTCNLTEVILKGKDIELLLLKKDVQKKLSTLGEIDIKTLPTTVTKQVNFISGDIDLGVLQDMDRPLLSKMRTKRLSAAAEGDRNTDWPEFTDTETQTDLSHTDIKVNSEDDSDESSSDDSDSESSSGSDSDDEDSESEEKEDKELIEAGVQTEKMESSDSESDSEEETEKPEMVDCSTETDEISTEEKGVNTRSRSLQSVNQSPQLSPVDDHQGYFYNGTRIDDIPSTTYSGYTKKTPLDDGEAVYCGFAQVQRRSPPKEVNGEDNSLAARRRRRRERAATTHFGSYSIDDPTQDAYQKRGSRFLSSNSVDHEDVFYDSHQHNNPSYTGYSGY